MGSEGTTYRIVMEGDVSGVQAHLESLSWVAGIKASSLGEQTTWQVSVTDETAAKSELFRILVCDEHVVVLEFGRMKYELEDVFLSIVEGGSDVQR